MSDEIPVLKEVGKYTDFTEKNERPISTLYTLESGIDPEKKSNISVIPSELTSNKLNLDINGHSFVSGSENYKKCPQTEIDSKTQNAKVIQDSNPAPALENSMERWARKDLTKQIQAAEEYKKRLVEETIKDDKIKRTLRDYLYKLTKENYENTKLEILKIIKDNVNYQEKFLDVLFEKILLFERDYFEIYAKLCKELHKELPQKIPNKEVREEKKNKKENSVMRAKLLDKCREIFHIRYNEKFDEYIEEKDPIEREKKIKKMFLGNVCFITELIKIKILTKKIAPVCINNLFERYENIRNDIKLRLINLEAIIIFTDQFARLVYFKEKKMEPEEAKTYNDNIKEIIQKLDKIKDIPSLPGFIKYKIINLIETRKNNYQKPNDEKNKIVPLNEDVEKKYENYELIDQDTINKRMERDLINYRDFIEEKGSSEEFPWKETTYLYETKGINLDDILEGYILGCCNIIEEESNLKYAKDFIKELIEYYESDISKEVKRDLKDRLFNLFELVGDYVFELPLLYDVYSYIIYIFLSNNIMEVKDLEGIMSQEEDSLQKINDISIILKKIYYYYKEEAFKEELTTFEYVKKNQSLFEWVYNYDEKNKEEEEKDED